MKYKSYRELTCPELVAEFKRITNGYVHNGRDAHLLRKLMDDSGYGPVQIAYGMHVLFKDKRFQYVTKDIPTFVRHIEDWEEPDELVAAAELILMLDKGLHTPSCFSNYVDLIDAEGSSRNFLAFVEAKQRLKEWVDDQLPRLNTGQRRTGPASSNRS